MRNAVLHLLTNKANDFGIVGLPVRSSYTPFIPSAEEDVVRSALHINTAPYYLINSLTAVYTFNDILSEFRETECTFKLHALPYPKISITNATYANTTAHNFSINNIPTSFPSPNYFTWVIEYNDLDTLVVRGGDKRITVPYILDSVVDGDNTYAVLSADWPAELGLQGALALNAGVYWSAGATISMSVPPVLFPYNHAINKVIVLPATHVLLTAAGLSRNFYNAQSYIEKYALLMLALAQPAIRNPV